MGTYDAKFAAYERAMQQHNDFGLKGKAVGEQLGRYAAGLQYDETKAANREFGRQYARELAAERKAAALSASEQTALTEGLSGQAPVTEPITRTVETPPQTPEKIKVEQKMKVGTAKTGFKFYLIDKEGKTYQVDRKTYNGAKKGKMASLGTGTAVDTSSPKVARKVKKASGKIKTKNISVQTPTYNVITDPQALHNQRQDMYNKLFGKGEQVPMHNYNVVTDPQALHNQRQDMYNKLFGKGEQVPMHNYNVVTDPQALHNQRQDMYNKLFTSEESFLREIKGDLRTVEGKINGVASAVEQNGSRISSLAGKVEAAAIQNGNRLSSLERAIGQNTQSISTLSNTVAKQGEEISTLTKQMAKMNKRTIIIAGLATIAAGTIGYLAGKANSKETEAKQEIPVIQEVSEEHSEPVKEETSVPAETAAANPTAQTDSVSQVNPIQQAETEKLESTTEETKLFLQLDTNGNYLTQKGDSFWKIAERYLKDKFKNEPEKFEKLSNKEKNIMIQKECERIMRQNGYWYDEDHNLPVPMLYQKVKIETFEKNR